MKMVDGDGIISRELRSIIENTNDLMFVKNRDSVYIASSKNYAINCVRCNGIEDVIGKTDLELFEDQAIAEKYRADDRALFESGKTMVEFEEDYPDSDGTKHRCLTTKYVLHDKDGNPVAIFGQYHDIGVQAETEIAHRREVDRHVVNALSKSFFAANYADLKTHKYVTVQSMDYARKMVEGCETIEQAFEAFIQTLVKPEFHEKMREFCETETIAERVKGKRQIDCEYLSNVASGWCRASFFPTEWDEQGEVTHVLFVVSGIDEDKSKELEESIENKRDLETIFDEVPGGIIQYRWDGKELKILKISKYYQELYGDSLVNDTNSPDYVRIHPDDLEGYQKAIRKDLTETHHLEYVFRAWAQKFGKYVWTQINAISKPQKDGTSLVYAIYTDITRQKEAEIEVEKKQASLEVALRASRHESEHDSLTGLYNRATVFKKCRLLLEAHPEEQFVMLHINVRYFHLYNTFFGEEGGNRLLCEMANGLNYMGKEYDLFAHGRIEADVFCVFFPVNRGLFEEHVRQSFERLETFSPNFPLRLAIGAYWITDQSMPIEAMFSRATIAAKTYKKNLFGLISRYDEGMDQELKDTQQITSEMTTAIENEEFQVYLQPKYALRSDKMVGAEALVRWIHPVRGMISPGKFIPAFEKNGFIAELDRYMWEHVCQILRNWKEEGKPIYPVSVNISRVSMYSHATVPFLKSLIEKYEIEPKYLELELTETAYMDDPEDLKRMLKELQEYGFHILMDDFGSGYSSLNTLRDLPVDVLKLDMKFLSTVQDDERGNAVLSSVVRMSKLLKLPIVAEGVETQKQADYLRSIGCEYVQGYLFAKPMPTPDYETLLDAGEMDTEESGEEEPVSIAEADVVLEEPFLPLGLLEYDKDRFAYLRTNKKFLKEFDLIENLKPASRVFRDHMDDKSYETMIRTFANCSEKRKDTVCSLQWTDDDGNLRKYHGYVHYHGHIGNYADLTVTFMNVTEIDRIGFEEPIPEIEVQNGTELSTDTTNAIVRALDNTGVRLFMYYPQTKSITVPEKACQAYHCSTVYENMPQSFADDYVYEEDYHNFNAMYYAIDRGEKTATAIFHSKDLNFCNHVTLTTVSWLENGQPKEVVGIIEDMSDTYKNEKLVKQLKQELSDQSINDDAEEALKIMATAIGNQYFAVYYIWLESHTYICFQEQMDGILSLIGEKGDYEPAWDQYINGYIDERDQQGIREFIEIDTLADRIGRRSSISYTYRRKEIGWTRGQFIVGKRDENGKPLTVVYTVTDINEEIETKLLKQKAEQEALQDPLTKLWNRKAFEQFIKHKDYKCNQTGLMVFDIDRFKGINDQFGHEVGDQVIIEVAQAVRGLLRSKDLVFRMGGDEFAVLLYNCNASIWNITCRKIEALHTELSKSLSSEMHVTISAGICVNENGYSDEMYKLADQAMYNTKVNGRGGCSFISLEDKILDEWHDQSDTLRKGDVLEKNSTVIWRLDKPKKEDLKHRVHGDELFCAFVGLDKTASSEKLYQAWVERVDTDNFDIIKKAAQHCITDGKVEVVFAWNHPEKGLVKLRCSASLEDETEDYYTFIGYIHVITGIHVVTMEDIDSNVKNALEELFFCNFNIRLCDYSFKVYKAQQYMKELLENCENAIDAVNSYVNYMVADESKEEMKAFLDMTTLQQRMKDTNVLECVYHDPNIGWSKAIFTVVDRNEENDAETVALVVEEISQTKELSMVETHLQHSLEQESVLWNSIKTLISTSDIRTSTNSILQDVMKYYDADRAYIFEFDWEHKIGINTYEICAPNVEPMIDTLQAVPFDAMGAWIDLFNKNSLIHIKDLNTLVGDESRKDEYDILVVQEIQSLIAAPVYFENKLVGFLGVDNPKDNLDDTTFIESLAFFCVNVSARERERAILEQQNMHDSLTGVYNRHGYDEILRYHEEDQKPVSYIQLDVDNFKKLNDTYGHAFGDEVLKKVADQLTDAFRADDYVFRLGGDEFAVLLTNCKMNAWNIISDKQHMIHLRLNQNLKKEIYVTLSMGISYSDSGFKEELVALSDAALYKVKSDGRAGCCVFDSKHNQVYQWKDDIVNDSEINPLAQSNTGACRLELPDNDLNQGRLICNEIARVLMGFDEFMTPEECFQTWLKCIDSYSMETIRKTLTTLMEKGQAECTYIYHHPLQGQIMVRSGGKCVKNENGIVCSGYHQSLQDTRIVLHEDDSQKLIDAMTGLYFASYYIDLQEDWYCIFKSTAESRHLEKQEIPASVAIKNFVQTLVKPEYREMMNEFVDFKTLVDRLQDRQYVEAEYQSMVEEKGWCRIRLLAVSRDEKGAVTHVQLLVASIDKEKKAHLEREEDIRNAMKIQLRVGEIVAQTTIQQVGLIDRKTGITKIYMNGMVSRDAIEVSFDEMRQWGMGHTYALDSVLLDKKFNLEYIESEINKKDSCVMAFRQAEENGEISTLIHHYEICETDPSKILVVIENTK